MERFRTFISAILAHEAVKQIGSWCAIAAFLSSTVYFLTASFSGGTPPPIYVRAIIALGLAAAVFAILSGVALVLMLRTRKRAAQADISDDRLLRVLTEFNKALATDYLFCRFIDAQMQSRTVDEAYVLEEFHRYVVDLLDHVSSMFLIYTGRPCAACIKIFSESQTEKIELNLDSGADRDCVFVFTLGRDKNSLRERSDVDDDGSPLALYPYSWNTALRSITHDPAIQGYYVGENLKPGGSYANARPGWDKYYDAVAVASLKNPTKRPVQQALGFLCVDNKGGGFIDNGTAQELLESLASVAYYSIRKTIALVRANTNVKEIEDER